MLGFNKSSTINYTHSFINENYTNLHTSEIIWINLNNIPTVYDTLTQKYYFNYVKKVYNDSNSNYLDIYYYFENTFRQLQKIDVEFYDKYGFPYDFNHKNNSFTIEIVYILDVFLGTHISATRNITNT